MKLIVDILLLIFFSRKDTAAQRQREAFKNRKAIAEAKKREEDTALTYIILDDLGKSSDNGSLQYQEPSDYNFHCDDDGPDW